MTLNFEQTVGIIGSAFLLYVIIMIVVRINGLRSFSKMSGHDFSITVAIGSILATSVVAEEPSILQGGLAIAALLSIQSLFSLWRLRRDMPYMENTPLLLMRGSEIIQDNLKKARITEADLMAKLREANVLSLNEVQAVILEQTGDVSVLHGDKKIDPALLKSVDSE